MEEQDYKQLIDTAAKNQFLEQSDVDFLASYFEKSLDIVVEDIISRQVLLSLAYSAGNHLN